MRSVVLKVWMDNRLAASASPRDLQEVQMIRLPPRTTESETLRGGPVNLYLLRPPAALDIR